MSKVKVVRNLPRAVLLAMVALNTMAREFADVVSCGVMNGSMAKQGNRDVSPDFNSLKS